MWPDVVLATQRHDAHQDHRTLAELVFHPLDPATAQDKVRLLHEHYPSQLTRDWFDAESFLGLSRLRGVQCRSRYAEAFVMEKTRLQFGKDPIR